MAYFGTNAANLLIPFIDDTYELTLLQNRPFIDRITKKSGQGGKSAVVPFNDGFGGGSGSDMATAMANAASTGGNTLQWTIDPAKVYGIEKVLPYEADFTKGPESAMDAYLLATTAAMEKCSQEFENLIFGTGYGNYATISTATNTSGNIWVLVLTVPSAVTKFEPGTVIVSKATAASGSLDTGTGTVTVQNYLNASITVDVGASGMVPTAGHVIGVQSIVAASTSVATFPGIFAFIPTTADRGSDFVPTTTSFLGVDRSQGSVVATSGWAYDGRNKPLFSSVNIMAGKMANYKNSKASLGICNPETLAQFQRELQTNFVKYESNSRPDVYFDGIDVLTGAGKIELMAESACPSNVIVITNPKTWVFAYPDKFITGLGDNGSPLYRAYDKDEMRAAVRINGMLYTTNPAATAVITVA